MSEYSGMDPETMMAAMGPMMLVWYGVWFVICCFFAFLQWKVFSKAGYPGWIGLLWVGLGIPLLNILAAVAILVVWIWFAFAEWPVIKKAQGGA